MRSKVPRQRARQFVRRDKSSLNPQSAAEPDRVPGPKHIAGPTATPQSIDCATAGSGRQIRRARPNDVYTPSSGGGRYLAKGPPHGHRLLIVSSQCEGRLRGVRASPSAATLPCPNRAQTPANNLRRSPSTSVHCAAMARTRAADGEPTAGQFALLSGRSSRGSRADDHTSTEP